MKCAYYAGSILFIISIVKWQLNTQSTRGWFTNHTLKIIFRYWSCCSMNTSWTPPFHYMACIADCIKALVGDVKNVRLPAVLLIRNLYVVPNGSSSTGTKVKINEQLLCHVLSIWVVPHLWCPMPMFHSEAVSASLLIVFETEAMAVDGEMGVRQWGNWTALWMGQLLALTLRFPLQPLSLINMVLRSS